MNVSPAAAEATPSGGMMIQLLLRINARLVEREFRAWTGSDESGGIEFDMPPIGDVARIGTLLRYVRMSCDDLRSEASSLSHPLVADRVVSGLVSILLTSMPHYKRRAIGVAADQAIAPFFVRRVEKFIGSMRSRTSRSRI